MFLNKSRKAFLKKKLIKKKKQGIDVSSLYSKLITLKKESRKKIKENNSEHKLLGEQEKVNQETRNEIKNEFKQKQLKEKTKEKEKIEQTSQKKSEKESKAKEKKIINFIDADEKREKIKVFKRNEIKEKGSLIIDAIPRKKSDVEKKKEGKKGDFIIV